MCNLGKLQKTKYEGSRLKNADNFVIARKKKN